MPLVPLFLLLAGVLLALSLIETSITHFTAVELHVLQEKSRRSPLLERIVAERSQVLIPVQFCIQLSQIGLAVLGTRLEWVARSGFPLAAAFLAAAVCVMLMRQLVPRLVVLAGPERVFFLTLPLLQAVHRPLCWVSWPLVAFLDLTRRWRDAQQPAAGESEPTDEEIQAFLEVGEREGILEEHDAEMIQSVVEFGDTVVREVMTPRSEMVTIGREATLRGLRDLMLASKHSRIPVYADSPEQIIGMVSIRPLLAAYSTQGEGEGIAPLVTPVMFTPDSKQVCKLLRELQSAREYMAIVVNEYGEVAGLVTVEDLVEEIVGEIQDKDEQQEGVVREAPGRFLLAGDVELGTLRDLAGVDLARAGFATVSGWLVNRLGRVPTAGERAEVDGIRVEIISADRRRIHSLRLEAGRPAGARPAREVVR